MSFKNVETTTGAAVATAGTITFAYPTNTNAGSFAAFGHKLWVEDFQSLLSAPGDFTVSFGASDITVTYNGTTTIPASCRVNAQFNVLGADDGDIHLDEPIEGVAETALVTLNLGAPDTADANGYVESQDLTALGVFSVDVTAAAALAAAALDGEADVPRNVVAAWTGTAVLTITGTDADGNIVVESSASGTSLAGKKAFKTITDITTSADITSLTVGTGDVLGLPVFLPGTAYVLKELEDGAAATAGTLVAGITAAATATTGDVRGTYDANSAADGAKVFELITALPDPSYKGVAQYAG